MGCQAGCPPGFRACVSLPLSASSSLSALGSDTTPLPSWASLNSSTWGSLKQALKGLSVEFALLADKAAQQVSGRAPEASVPRTSCAVVRGASPPEGDVRARSPA